MAGQAVVVPVPSRPNQAHQRTDYTVYTSIRPIWAMTSIRLYEPIRFRLGCRRRATSHKDIVTWRYVALHGRRPSSFCQRRRSAAVTVRRKLRMSAAGQKFFILWPAYKSPSYFLGQDFVVNFATYTQVYTVSGISALTFTNKWKGTNKRTRNMLCF